MTINAAAFGAALGDDSPIRDRIVTAARNLARGPNALTRELVSRVSKDREVLRGDRRASLLAQVTSEDRGRRRLGGEVSGAVAQAGGDIQANFSDALDNALRRTKMRSRVQSMGDAQVEQQGLRDRIAVAKSSRSREGDLINASGRAAQIRYGVNIAQADANQAVREGQYGLAGTVLGAGLARYLNRDKAKD